ncbi:hypothetical protein [Cellulomonas carbonis]|uniref:Lipoprotein n=1 Tax=Cellulomonas carbonis T26 TaxID=947969 RepID=A0A0A0BTW1_9CELL|nr:hypothetical protein [Cellulomonas carbonis]KGM11127.1 hypothetical protein N868_12345 [Cellulomonas carbonis T26]GGC09835.1 hypothetical protein GCM10010972_23870 [Cellulomonas carbonis]
MQLRARPVVGACVVTAAVLGATGCSDPEPPRAEPSATVTLEPTAIEPAHAVRVAASGGCPGYGLTAPVTPRTSEGSTDLELDDESWVTVRCLGPLEQAGTALEAASPWPDAEEAPAGTRTGPVLVVSAYGEAFQADTHFTSNGARLTEWFVERDGYLVAVGYLRHEGAVDRTATVEAVLASWEWA